MKGLIFTEFLEMVESRHGLEMVDRLIQRSDLPSGGAYTSVGTYDHAELVRMIVELSAATSLPVKSLIRGFGIYLFMRLAAGYPAFFRGVDSTQEFLAHVEDHIHVEVLKLYPDAELPRVIYRRLDSGQCEVRYSSTRPFGDLAEGLILGCIEYFKQPLTLTREDLPPVNGFYSVLFTVTPAEVSA